MEGEGREEEGGATGSGTREVRQTDGRSQRDPWVEEVSSQGPVRTSLRPRPRVEPEPDWGEESISSGINPILPPHAPFLNSVTTPLPSRLPLQPPCRPSPPTNVGESYYTYPPSLVAGTSVSVNPRGISLRVSPPLEQGPPWRRTRGTSSQLHHTRLLRSPVYVPLVFRPRSLTLVARSSRSDEILVPPSVSVTVTSRPSSD